MARESNLNRLIRFSNILKEYRTFNNGKEGIINYDYSCPEYQILKEKYHLEEIAKEGTSLEKAKRLLHYFAVRLYHCPWYDNHVECNSLKLLEYAFENEKQGINCLNKSKILQECLLALHIPARRVSICPYSPYDFDSHVVTEFYSKEHQKWMMIDPTFDGFFIDEKRIPLSVLEIREHLVNDEFATFVNTTSKMKNLYILRNKNMYKNSYFAKNLFFIFVDQYNGFGVGKDYLFLIPEGFSIKERSIKNWEYRLANLNKENEHLRDRFKQRLEEAKNMSEPTAYSTSTVTNIKNNF